jgi:putative membrane-bound dehydrogenase-like protein
MPRRFVLVFFFGLLATPFAPADTALPKVPDGFQVELVLQAPDIEAPTALCVAPNGDVYFAEDPMDMRGPPTKNIDKIWLLKGGDPKKKILFADHMWAVMGLEIVRDKLFVVHAPHVSVFTLDKDGTAAKRQDLFTDLGPPVAGVPSFNDHIPSGIRMGMDGWLYVSIGDKGIPKMTRKELNQGSVHVAEGRWRHSPEGHHISLEGGGVIRFRPDGSGLEVFASGTRNHLDVPMDEHDRIFVRDNTDDGLGWWTRLMYLPHGAFMGYPWAYTKHPDETLPMVRDFGGGAPCGGWVYCDDGLPETYRGRVFHCEWGQGKVYAVKLAPDGAGFKFVDQITLMDPGKKVKEFRPFTLRPTADGRGFYVTDWGYGGWLDKRKAGRLWKVTYTRDDVKPAPRGKGADSIEQLITALDHPAHSERLRAQRELIAKGKAGAEAAQAAIESQKLSPVGVRHALWVVADRASGWQPEEWEPLAARLTDDRDAGVRLEAVRVLENYEPQPAYSRQGGFGVESLTVKSLNARIGQDPDAQVRLHAALILKVLAGQHPLDWLATEKDRWVRFALVRGLRQVARKGRLNWDWSEFKSNPAVRQMLVSALTEEFNEIAVWILSGIEETGDPNVRRQAVAALARVYKDRKPYAGTWWGTQPAGRKPPPHDVTWRGTRLVRQAILAALKDSDASVRKAAVVALAEMKDPETLDPIVMQYAAEKDSGTRVDLVRAVVGLATPQAVAFLAGISSDGRNADALRLEAIAGLEKADTAEALAALEKMANPSQPVVVQVRSLEALGVTKSGNVRAVLSASLKSTNPTVRKTAVTALASRGGADGGVLVPLLADGSAEVRNATARALGTLKHSAAVPDLVRATGDEETQFDAITALTKMPDRRALSAYLTGLGSKNVDLRKACTVALQSIRTEVVSDLEQLAKRNEIRAEVLPELRNVYAAFAPVLDWKIIGPFADDHQAHPPEKEIRLDATYRSLDQDVHWQTKRGDQKHHGVVRLDKILQPNTSVVAYAHVEMSADSARDAELLIGSDDTVAIWVNGKKVHEYDGSRGWSFDQEKVHIHLDKGVNRLLVRCGNFSGPWEFSVAVSDDASRYAFLNGAPQKYDLDAFRSFARSNSGDAGRGNKLFRDIKGLACIKCHAVGGEGGRVGPDLAGIALKYKREDLMTSVLEPSKTIAQGYETIVLTLKSGKTLTGVFKGESADAVNLADAEGKEYSIAKKDIDERYFSPVSTMPNGLSDGMTLQDFADLIAFLESRREEPTNR